MSNTHSEMSEAELHAPAPTASGRKFLATPADGSTGDFAGRVIATADLPAGTGTVTSVTATAPITSSGGATPNITHDASGVSAGTVSGITVDAKGHVTAKTALVASDIPSLDTAKITTGTLAVARGGTNAATASANTVFRGPTSGGAAAPSFGALVAADLPARNIVTVSTNTTLNSTHDIVLVDTGAGDKTITLPTAVAFTRTYTIKNIGANLVLFAFTGGQTLDGSNWAGNLSPLGGSTSVTAITVASDNANWWIIESYTSGS